MPHDLGAQTNVFRIRAGVSARQLGRGFIVSVIVQNPLTNADLSPNILSILVGDGAAQAILLLPGTQTPELFTADLKDVYVRIQQPIETSPAVPGVPAVAAIAQITATDVGTVGSQLFVGANAYTIVAAAPGVDEIAIGVTADDYATNIAAAVTVDVTDTFATAVAVGAVITLTAAEAGAAGNSIFLATDDPDLTIDSVFAGGADEILPIPATFISSTDIVVISRRYPEPVRVREQYYGKGR